MHPVESASVLGWWPRVVVGNRQDCVGIDGLLLWRQLGALCVMNLGAAEVAVFRTLQVHVVQHALVVDSLRCAAAKTEKSEQIHMTKAMNSLLVVQITAALVQAVGVLSELIVARLLDHAEEVQGASRHGATFGNALPRILQLGFAQHVFLQRKFNVLVMM